MAKAKTKQQLALENDELRVRLQEMEETLEAIRSGAVDAIVTSGPRGDQVYTLEGADHAYHMMVETMNEGAVTISPDGTLLYGNPRFAQMTGSSPSAVAGRRFHDFVCPSDYPLLSTILQKEGRDCPIVELRLRNSPDADTPVQIAISPIELGCAKALTLVITDLSAQKRYDEIVAEEKLSRRILEQAQEAIAVCIDGCIVRANRALYEICGCVPLMQPFDRIFSLRMSESETFSIATPESGKTIKSQEVRYQRPDGQIFNLILSAGPVMGQGNKVMGTLISLVDITERKRAEEDLRRSEARFRLLSATAGQLLATDDPQGLINNLCRDIMGFLDCQAFFNFMVDERAGKLRLNACAGIPEAEVRRLEWLDYGVAVCGCAARDQARIIAEDIFHTPDVRTELVKSYGIQAYCCHPLKAQNRLIGTLSFGTKTRTRFTADEVELMRIVTDQVAVAMQRVLAQQEVRASEEALRLANEHLEQRVRERTMDLQNLTEQLERSRHNLRNLASELVMAEERERKRIAGVLHDEIAQTLAAVRMRLDMIQGIPSAQEERLGEAKALLVQSIREARALMTDIGNPLLFDMGLQAACESLADRLMKRHPIRIRCDIRDSYKHLNPDVKTILYQVVRELLTNVVKHSKAHNADVVIDREEEHFRVKVTDDGVGFDTGTLGAPTAEGGFGLYSIRERLIAMDGSLTIESTPGAGTVVTAILPLALD